MIQRYKSNALNSGRTDIDKHFKQQGYFKLGLFQKIYSKQKPIELVRDKLEEFNISEKDNYIFYHPNTRSYYVSIYYKSKGGDK